jgi:hypothetical protein
MKESKTREISFPDISPATWESMMKFLDNPLAGRLMTVEDVMELAPWYHKYDFPKGLELSGHILTEHVQAAAMKADHAPDNLDIFIDAILLADTFHLDEAQNAGVRWINTVVLHDYPNIFSRDHITKLAPLFAKEESLFATVQLFIKSGVTKDNILHNPFFADLLVEKFASCQKVLTILDLVGVPTPSDGECIMLHITVSGSGCDADGDYIGRFFDNRPNAVCFSTYPLRCGLWGDQATKFMIIVRDDIWVIAGYQLYQGEVGLEEDEMILWKRPHSYTLMLPPRDGWVPVDELARGKNPKLTYRTHQEE